MSALAPSRFYRLRRIKRQLVCLVTRRFQKCAWLVPAERPIHSINFQSKENGRGNLLIFLPGIGDLPEDYERNGFIEAVRRSEISIDIIVADLHFGYYLTRTAVERLRDDIVLPARGMGYRHIALAGISLGGFGALYYAMHHPEDIFRIFLLAPYLGDADIIAEITEAGGPKTWHSEDAVQSDYQRNLWQWLKEYEAQRFPALYLGYGRQDIFVAAHELLAGLLPKEQVYVIDGRHDWHTWKYLWSKFLIDL
jgi:pimeloyl-ACP methyl ester carboxylesterase